MAKNASSTCFCGDVSSAIINQKNKQDLVNVAEKELKNSSYYLTTLTLELKLKSAYMQIRNKICSFFSEKDKPIMAEEYPITLEKIIAEERI